jgi:hypothetical protein
MTMGRGWGTGQANMSPDANDANLGDSVSAKEYRDLFSHAHDQAFKILELRTENIRLRDLLDCKVGSSIRVELPSKDNGWKCYVTTQRAKDEEHIAGILADSITLLCKVAYEVRPIAQK